MSTTDTPNLTETIQAASPEHVAELVREADANGSAIYPIGGGTSLDFGLPAKRPGLGLQLTGLSEVADYPARDMTITVGAGITMEQLQKSLALESQRLPIDAPAAAQATLGGLIASNHSGPMRYGHGTMRDHVIGIRAVDGRGESFAAGGRVVKNVAGYDFCKLLTGSLGTLGVITEVTLKLKPIPPTRVLACCRPQHLDHAEQILRAMVTSNTTPTAIELMVGCNGLPGLGESDSIWLVVRFEGTETEVQWMLDQIQREWNSLGVASPLILQGDDEAALYDCLVDYPVDQAAALAIKVTGVPSGVAKTIKTLQAIDESVSIQAHAGNGVVIARFHEYPDAGMANAISRIRSVASASHGNAIILSNPSGDEATHQSVWGAAEVRYDLMRTVKEAFDPRDTLNPGRFVY